MLKNRHKLRNKDAKNIANIIEKNLGCRIMGKIEIGEFKDISVLFIEGRPYGVMVDNSPYLNVEGLRFYKPTKKFVTVDDGAIKYILNGADVMSPGIIEADYEIKSGDLVWARDERYLPLMMGRAYITGDEMVLQTKGKAVENLHHIQDELWKISKHF
jgi:PUA domain protein